MNCPNCDSAKTRVLDVVHDRDAKCNYRKRKCSECGETFYTTEINTQYKDGISAGWNKFYRRVNKKHIF